MAETSFFFDGTTVGDATLAPYDDAAIANAISECFGGDFVVADYYTMFNLESTGMNNGSVWLNSGVALCKGILFESDDAITIALDAQGGGLNRIDRIVLRYDDTNKTVRPTLIKGTAAAVPSPPSLTANDMPLWYIWVPNGFTTTSIVSSYDIHDERVINHPSSLSYYYDIENYMPNSELMAYSQAHATSAAPEGWKINGAIPICTGTTALGNVVRGRAVDVQLNPGDVLETFIELPADATDETPSRNYWITVKGMVKPKTGDLHLLVDQYSFVFGSSLLDRRTYYRYNTAHEFLYRVSVDTSQYQFLRFRWFSSGGCTFEFGQILVTKGLTPGPFRPKRETVLFYNPLTDASWSATSKTTGTTTVDLSASFNGNILQDTRGLLMRLYVQPGAAGDYLEAINKTSPASCVSGKAVALYTSGTSDEPAFVGLDSSRQFRLNVSAAGSLTCTAQIWGVYI